jgi:hypothetical protein
MRVEHRAAIPSDIDALFTVGVESSNLQEIWRVSFLRPEAALCATFAAADYRVSSWYGDEILALWGASRKSLVSKAGVCWLVASKSIAKYPIIFARESKKLLGIFDAEYTYLENYIDADNHTIIRWLKWLGFTFDPLPTLSASGHPVLRFWR